MPYLRVLNRLLLILILLLAYSVISFRLLYLDEHKRLSLIHGFYTRLGRILGLTLKVSGHIPTQPCLLVANHISWHDIVVIGQQIQPDFVAKSDILSWPILGKLAARAGTIYIERGNRDSAKHIHQTLEQRLASRCVLVFPEGTTSSGVEVLPFKRRLFEAAHKQACLIQPIALHYLTLDKQGQTLGFIEDSLFDHLKRSLSLPTIEVHMHFCEPFMPIETDLRHSAQEAQQRIVLAKAHLANHKNPPPTPPHNTNPV